MVACHSVDFAAHCQVAATWVSVISSLTKTKVILNEKITLSLTKTETETKKFELTRTE